MKRASIKTHDTSRLLILVRHGKAAPRDVGLSDFERTLTNEGVRECDRVAAEMSKKNLSIDLMISSPADRALETAHLFAQQLGYPYQKIQIVAALYSADSISPILAFLRRLPVTARIVVVFGHNPMFDDIAAHVVPGFLQSLPKGAAAAIAIDAGTWAGLKKGCGRLQFLISPPKRNVAAARARRRRAS